MEKIGLQTFTKIDCSPAIGDVYKFTVKDWRVLLKAIGYEDDVLVRHANDNFICQIYYVARENRVTAMLQAPLPKHVYNFELKYKTGDLFRDKINVAVLSLYDKDEIKERIENLVANYLQVDEAWRCMIYE